MDYEEYGLLVGFVSFFVVIFVVNRKRKGKQDRDEP